ncbi:MAG TPA: TetR/AcrR family transcriptional regulator [Acidobacteriota bacterium]|nr:TetR/AcrR family transcriptional regulator [Acidobacteriota bacterium]
MKGTRNRIISKAMELFARKGYAGSSIREICAAAGITKPVLYYHFRSKEHLFQELMLDLFNQTRKNLLRLSNYRGPLRERLVLYVSSEFRNCSKDPNGVRFLFRSMFAPEGEYPQFNFVEEFKREREIIAMFIGENMPKIRSSNAERISNALMGMILIHILEFLFTLRPKLTRRTAEKLVDFLMPFFLAGNSSIPIGKGKGGRPWGGSE